MLSDKVYNIIKWLTVYVLPPLGTLYFALSGIWGFPFGEEIVGTIVAIETFLGALIGISTYTYNKTGAGIQGTLMIDETNPNLPYTQLDFNDPLSIVAGEKTVTLKVDSEAALTNPSIYK